MGVDRRAATSLAAPPAVLAAVLAVVGPAAWLVACDYTSVRDAAFKEPRDVHRLAVIGDPDDAQPGRTHERLTAWAASLGDSLNLMVVRIDPEAPDVKWEEYGIPSAPPSLPVVTLSGWRRLERKGFLIDHWEPEPSDKDLELIRTSAAREAIRQEAGRRVAVLVYVAGDDPEASARIAKLLDTVVDAWNKKQPLGLAVVRVSRTDERERLLLAFAGIRASGPDWVAVAFGRGKLMQPLQGDEITAETLDEQIELLAGECTCLRSPSSLGVDLPLMWSKDLDATVDMMRTNDEAAASTAQAPPLDAAPTHRRLFATVVTTLAALAAGVGITAVAIIWRRRDQQAA
ncbi:MAG: hypothetical protein HY718_18460 [Planctomycetes bacterium]|nr:hypothetical protein [Planctomycetota bacterium]